MRTVLYCTKCRYGSPHFRMGCVRDSFGIRLRFVRDACLPACLPACIQTGSRYSYQYGTSYHEYSYISRTVPGPRGRSYGTVLHYMYIREPSLSDDGMRSRYVRDSFGIRSRFVRDACLPACLPAGRTVLYCTTCRYGSPHCRTGCVRDSFELRLGFVRDSFGMPAFLPASLHACMQAVGTRTVPVWYGTPYHEYSYEYISRTRGRSYGTVGVAMRPRCGDPPNKVCTAVGKLDSYI